MADLTRLLAQIEGGDPAAADALLPVVYQELRKLAAAKLARERQAASLQPTVLVHEAYLRLVAADQPADWNGRGHFFAAAAEAMRRILVERARRRLSKKHGGGRQRLEVPLDELPGDERQLDLLALDEALARLAARWPEKAQLVKLRFFAGLTIPEAARALKISVSTAERHWTFARAWLHAELSAD